MEVFKPLVQIVLVFLALTSFASSTPISIDNGAAHRLAPRGIVSPSNAELLHNII
jgi:hypothetical protein